MPAIWIARAAAVNFASTGPRGMRLTSSREVQRRTSYAHDGGDLPC